MLANGTETPLASIVVPAYKSRDTIAGCLRMLLAQETELPYEVTVVESSGDGTADIVREKFPMVRIIESQERLLAGAARNLGADQSTGSLLLFIDSDCLAEPDWIERMAQAHKDWDCAVVAGAIMNANSRSPISISSYMNEFSDFFPYGEPRYVDYLPSGNICYNAEIFRKHGGFDPKFRLYEDLAFNRQLFRAGEKLLFDPGIRVAHHHRDRLLQYLRHEFGRGRAAAVSRRRGLISGAFWVKHPLLALAASPASFIRKSAVFPYRYMQAYPLDRRKLAHAMPYFYLALVVWHLGLISEAVENRPKREKVGMDSDKVD